MAKEPKHVRYLKSIGACEEATEFARGYRTLQDAWDACNVPAWLLWLLSKQASGIGSDSRKAVVFAAAQCARTALKYTQDPRVLACIETTEGYVRGENTLDDVETAAAAANTAAYDAAAAAAAAAAYAAYAANAAATHAAYDAAAAAAATFANAAATYDAAANAARISSDLECANIIKKLFPKIRMSKQVVTQTIKGGESD